jgi:hypothetical protein
LKLAGAPLTTRAAF